VIELNERQDLSLEAQLRASYICATRKHIYIEKDTRTQRQQRLQLCIREEGKMFSIECVSIPELEPEQTLAAARSSDPDQRPRKERREGGAVKVKATASRAAREREKAKEGIYQENKIYDN
jgi:hypothetical protein